MHPSGRGTAGAAEADPHNLAFCAAVVAGLPYRRGDEPCLVVQVRGVTGLEQGFWHGCCVLLLWRDSSPAFRPEPNYQLSPLRMPYTYFLR